MYPDEAQREYFGQDDVLSSASFAPSGTAVATEGGLQRHGRWSLLPESIMRIGVS
ncbi:MAG: hypothetical protein CM1200mP9_11240 [Gammaproteobacteria bacterium]|nr:MAG: hypothetical protein CM1200mP9_11240 [Gammaproteobacteria bacterium]